MAKGAAKEASLGNLHGTLTRVFTKVLQRYENNLDALSQEMKEFAADTAVDELLAEVTEPSPAMLSAIAKFLKDNDIGMDTEELNQLSDTERRLKDKRARRAEVGLSVVDIKAVGDR